MRKAIVSLLVFSVVNLFFSGIAFGQNPNCGVWSIPFTETFNSDSGSEQCWTVVNENGDNLTWDLDYNFAYFVYEGDEAATITKYWNSTTNDDYLITPTLQLNGNQRMRFHYRVVSSSSPTDLEILVSTTGTDVSDFTGVLMPQETISNGAYLERILYLDDYTGQVNIAFHTPQVDSNNWTLFIDEVIIEDIPACAAPTDLSVTETTNNSATLQWAQGYQETQWEVAVQPENSGEPTGSGTLVDNNTYVAENLDAATFYEYYVRAYCSGTAQSEWVGPFYFNTQVCATENMCNYTVTVEASYSGGNFSQLTVTQGGITVGQLNSYTTTTVLSVPFCNGSDFEMSWDTTYWDDYTSSVLITDAYDEVVYEWNAGDPISVPFYLGTASCDQILCAKPIDVVLTNQDINSVTLDWTEQGSATSWEIYVVAVGGAEPDDATTGIVANAHPFTIDGLDSGTMYTFYIRALCGGDNGNSSWTLGDDFATLIENDDCEGAILLGVSDGPYCDAPYQATIRQATASNQGGVCGDANFANDDVWFEFTATATSHIIYINNILSNGVPESQNVSHNLNKVIYTGSCTNLQEVLCVVDDNTDEYNYFGGFYTAPTINNDDILLENLQIGETYKLRVFSNYAEQRDFTFDICIATPVEAMNIDQTTYTVDELVTDVLMSDDCVAVSNINYTTGTTYGAPHNGIAYFNGDNTNFPFSNGILLTTGNALAASGPKLTMQSASFYNQQGVDQWLGDADLQQYLMSTNPGEPANLFDATSIEFDFVAYGDFMSFNFLFASEDYGVSQCGYGDGFALLLTDENGVTTNLAVLPDTSVAVSVPTIRDAQYNSACDSQNPTYFDTLFDGMMGVSRYASATNFYGATVPMVAQTALVPGNQYHLKIVIADEGDGNWDSGVFLQAGSFNIVNSIDLGEDILLTDGAAGCEGDPVVLDAGNVPAGTAITWYADGVEIEGENNSTLSVTTTATYAVEVVYPGTTCVNGDEIRVEFYPVPEITFGTDELFKCINEELTLEVTVTNANEVNSLTFTWYDDNGTQLQTGPSNEYLITETSGASGEFTVVATDNDFGCSASATVAVNLYTNANCIIPQGISPNNDGVNDCLDLAFMKGQGRDAHLKIYNRYGVEVYSYSDYADEWCGTDDDGKKLPVGTYYYVVSYGNGDATETGWVYLNY